MNLKRLLRKNWIIILLVLVVLLFLYYGNNSEGFQTTPKLDDKCFSKIDKIDGSCPNGFTLNKDELQCEKIYDSPRVGRTSNGSYNCVGNATKIGKFKCKAVRDSTCPSGYEKDTTNSFLCVKTGRLVCPPRHYWSSTLGRKDICYRCPASTGGASYYLNNSWGCKNKADGSYRNIITALPVCSVA